MSLKNTFHNDKVIPEDSLYSAQQCYDDPLEGVGDLSDPKCYRLDRIVFADPLNIVNLRESRSAAPREDNEEMALLDNITVTKKKNGRRKKLFVRLHDETNLACPVQNCSKTFTSPMLLKAHIRKVHYSEKNYICEVCGAGFSAQYLLKRHSSVHGEKKTQCPVCKKMLSLRTNLTLHLRSHADTRHHACQTCGKRFLRKTTLTIHAKVHRKENTTQDIKN